ncbi:MAG: hypothetical protein EXQ55_08440 [Acidobacteria bacterium]|nr:hypothetical protein [Acidobacteriota bacterium]
MAWVIVWSRALRRCCLCGPSAVARFPEEQRKTAEGRERQQLNRQGSQFEACIEGDGVHGDCDGEPGEEPRRSRAEQRHGEEAGQNHRAGDIGRDIETVQASVGTGPMIAPTVMMPPNQIESASTYTYRSATTPSL